MQKTDIITITLKGAKAKEYFLKRITENLGIRFKEIPKEPLVIEEKGNSEMAVEIFKKALELKFLEEVQFKVEESHKLTEPNKEEDSISNNDKDKANEKGLGDVQLIVLSFLKEHSGKEFLLGELSCNTDCIKSKLKVVLESLLKRNLIEKKKTTNGDVYFVAKNDEVDKNAELIPADTETESVQSDITDSTQLLLFIYLNSPKITSLYFKSLSSLIIYGSNSVIGTGIILLILKVPYNLSPLQILIIVFVIYII